MTGSALCSWFCSWPLSLMGKIALRLALLRRIGRPLGVFVHRQKADEVPLGAVNGHLTQGALGGTWASCAPQALASGPKHGQGCSQGGRWRQVGLRWAFRLVPARWGACAGTSALLPVEARPLGGTWASCAPQALASGPKHGQGSPAEEQKGFLRFHKTTATPGVRKASPPGPPRAVCRRPWLSRRFRQTVPVVADATDKTQIQVKSAGAQ